MESRTQIGLSELAFRLFKDFARMEYALKATGFHKGKAEVKADWQRFALTVEDALANPRTPTVDRATRYILNHPPKKQVVRHGSLQWDAAPYSGNSNADRILVYVRRVRNNLFHGAKFSRDWFDPARSRELLKHSLTILSACREASYEVREAYRS
jgi:hypothetical protein